MSLIDKHMLQAIGIIGIQLDFTENAHIRQRWAPVPARLVHRRAQMRRAGDGVAVVHIQIVLALLLGKIAHRGGELQCQGIFPRQQAVFDLVDIGAVHILNAVKALAVQRDPADRVQTMEHQLHIVMRKQRLAGGKLRGKRAVLFAEMLQFSFVQAVEGIGDFFVLQQDAVHRAGRLAG